jgi:hypothetical protein
MSKTIEIIYALKVKINIDTDDVKDLSQEELEDSLEVFKKDFENNIDLNASYFEQGIFSICDFEIEEKEEEFKSKIEEEYHKLYGGKNTKNPPFKVGNKLKQIYRVDDNDILIRDGREEYEFVGMKDDMMLLKTLNSYAAFGEDIFNKKAVEENKKNGYNPPVGQTLQLHFMYADRYEII